MVVGGVDGGGGKHLIGPHVSHVAEGHRSGDFPRPPLRATETHRPSALTQNQLRVQSLRALKAPQ